MLIKIFESSSEGWDELQISHNGKIIGGFQYQIIDRYFYYDSIWLKPEYQNSGLGVLISKFMFNKFRSQFQYVVADLISLQSLKLFQKLFSKMIHIQRKGDLFYYQDFQIKSRKFEELLSPVATVDEHGNFLYDSSIRVTFSMADYRF